MDGAERRHFERVLVEIQRASATRLGSIRHDEIAFGQRQQQPTESDVSIVRVLDARGQLMPLTLAISCSRKSRLVLPFWCRLTRLVPDKIQEGRKTVVCVLENICVKLL